jgi:single-strand DNA-binding protein
MASRNMVLVLGYLGKDPELRYLPDGKPAVSFSVATTEKWKGKDGQAHEHTEWFRVEVVGPSAKFCSDYMQKGSLVDVVGRQRTDEWTDKAGNKRTTVKVVADRVQLCGKGRERQAQTREPGEDAAEAEPVPF